MLKWMYASNMGSSKMIDKRLRQRLRDERERRDWSQVTMARMLKREGLLIHPSTVTKIEAGCRAVQPDELNAYADIFGTSIDSLMGRDGTTDLMWAISKLGSAAQQISTDIGNLRLRLINESIDVHDLSDDFHAIDIKEAVHQAARLLEESRQALKPVIDPFPLPTNSGPAAKGE
jgi:transcriptional regulator with XRE-family HTH domain